MRCCAKICTHNTHPTQKTSPRFVSRDYAGYTAPTRQHELDNTDQESTCPEKSRPWTGNRSFARRAKKVQNEAFWVAPGRLITRVPARPKNLTMTESLQHNIHRYNHQKYKVQLLCIIYIYIYIYNTQYSYLFAIKTGAVLVGIPFQYSSQNTGQRYDAISRLPHLLRYQ